jgi:putative colanic acid biosynthesis UDP-glucose lipid carrier transferase
LIFRKKKAIVQLILVILDLLALNLVFAVAAFILNEHWSNNQYLKVCLNYNMVWAISVYIFKYYDTPLVFEDILRKTTRFIFSNLVIVLLIYFTAFEDFVTSHYFFLLFMLLLTGSLLMNRFLAKMIENKLCLFNWANKKIVLIGHLTHLDKMINILGGSSQHVQIAGIFTSDADTPAPNVLGQFHQCVEYALNNGIDHIFSSIMPYDDSRIHDVVLDADRNGIRVKFIPDFNLLFRRKVSLDLLDNHIPVVGLRTEPLETVFSRVKKRIFDIVFSLFVFVFILSWLIPIISILILIGI